jgi:hypothetical protein
MRGKGMFVLHLEMSTLDFVTDPSFECADDDDIRDVTFVSATHSISRRDGVEEYLACGFFPLSTGFGFR